MVWLWIVLTEGLGWERRTENVCACTEDVVVCVFVGDVLAGYPAPPLVCSFCLPITPFPCTCEVA